MLNGLLISNVHVFEAPEEVAVVVVVYVILLKLLVELIVRKVRSLGNG